MTQAKTRLSLCAQGFCPFRAFITIWIHVWMSAGGARTKHLLGAVVQNDSSASGQSCVWSARDSAPQMQIRLTASYPPHGRPACPTEHLTDLSHLVPVGVVSGGRPPLANRENRSPESQR